MYLKNFFACGCSSHPSTQMHSACHFRTPSAEFLAGLHTWAPLVLCSKAAMLPVALVTITKWPHSNSPDSLQPSGSFLYKSEQSIMKMNAKGKTEVFYPDVHVRLDTLKAITAHTPFPWLGFNDATNEKPGLLQRNQAASEIMKRETCPNTLGTLSLLIYFLLQVKMYREESWSSGSIVIGRVNHRWTRLKKK